MSALNLIKIIAVIEIKDNDSLLEFERFLPQR